MMNGYQFKLGFEIEECSQVTPYLGVHICCICDGYEQCNI